MISEPLPLSARNGSPALFSAEAEMAVLGGMLIDRQAAAVAAEMARPLDFYPERHRQLFAALVELHHAGTPIDEITVSQALHAAGHFESAGGVPFLATLLDATPSAANIEYHIGVVQDYAARRALKAAAELVRDNPDDRIAQGSLMAALENAQRGGGRHPIPLFTLAELSQQDFPAKAWTVRGLATEGDQGIIFGGPGVGKSMLARHLSLAVASGRSAIGGVFAATRGQVLWVTAEETRAQLLRGFRIAAAGDGIPLEEIAERVTVVPAADESLSLSDPAGRRRLAQIVDQLNVRLVVLDTMASLASGLDLKDDQAVLPLLKWAKALAAEQGRTVLWLAHDRKTQQDARGDDLDALFGSRQVSAQIGFAWRMKAVEAGVSLIHAKMRDGVRRAEPYTLQRDAEEDTLHRFTLMDASVSGARDTMAAIQAELQEHPGSTLKSLRDTVAAFLRCRPSDVAVKVHSLIGQGVIRDDGTGIRGMRLHWVGAPCPSVSDCVPASGHVSVSRVPTPEGGNGDTVAQMSFGDSQNGARP
jgi:KaiC/GvpD/RAD55 family RecA-like ATPase